MLLRPACGRLPRQLPIRCAYDRILFALRRRARAAPPRRLPPRPPRPPPSAYHRVELSPSAGQGPCPTPSRSRRTGRCARSTAFPASGSARRRQAPRGPAADLGARQPVSLADPRQSRPTSGPTTPPRPTWSAPRVEVRDGRRRARACWCRWTPARATRRAAASPSSCRSAEQGASTSWPRPPRRVREDAAALREDPALGAAGGRAAK